jgi:PAS domain S-box-containing protein
MDKLQGEAPAVVGMAFQIVASEDGVTRRFSYVSPSCEAVNGIAADAAKADPGLLYDLILPEYRELMATAEAAALADMTPFSIEVPFRRKDGQVRWFRITSAPHRLADGSTVWDGIQLDITDQLLAQRRLEMALETTGLGLWEYDISNGQLYWSRRTRDLYGVGPDEPIDFDFYRSRLHPDDREHSLQIYETALKASGGDFAFEHRIALPDGGVRWILAHGRVVAEGGAPKLVIGTSLDITDRKETEEARALLLGELNHRVKNDFQIVSGLLELQARRSEDPAVRGELEKAQRRIAGIARAHQNLYAEDAREEVDVEVYLGDICRHLAEGLFQDANAALEWRIAACSISRERAVAIGLIVNELITNSLKHAFADGRAGRVEVVFEAHPDAMRLTVGDDGPGLPATYSQSRGLGRSLIQAFARQAGGRLERLDGPGARFLLTVPR